MEEDRFICQQLLEANKSAFDHQSFTTAYHALSGAMHCAYRIKDAQMLEEVETRANTQWDYLKSSTFPPLEPFWIEPPHETMLALYRSLSKLAHTRLAML